MAMQRPLDLTLVSAKDLKDVNLLTKMDLYAVVSLSVDPKTKLRTPVHHDCGRNPNWNHHMKLYVPEGDGVDRSSIFLHVLIRAEKTIGGDRDVGKVYIPVKDLEADARPGSGPKVVTYQVRTSSGRAKGVLTLSYKFGDPVPYPPSVGYPPPNSSKSGEPQVAYPMGAVGAYPAPAGPSTAYPATPPQAGYGYGAPPPGYGGHGYPPPPPQPVYAYPPPPAGYPGYAQQGQQPQQQKKKNNFGLGLGAGLLGGAIGGLLIGDAIGDAGAYDAGYDAGFDDAGGFDF